MAVGSGELDGTTGFMVPMRDFTIVEASHEPPLFVGDDVRSPGLWPGTPYIVRYSGLRLMARKQVRLD